MLLADAVGDIAEWEVPKFGSSDCYCTSHLFGMMENPIHNKKFMDVIEDFSHESTRCDWLSDCCLYRYS